MGAREAGAHRIELCVELDTGGLTPPVALLEAVRAAVDVPVFAMARPRPGSFVTTGQADVAALVADVARMREHGAHGVVVGPLRADATVDEAVTRACVQAAGGLPVTFHRAFDEVADPFAALETLVEAGVARILTGGGPGAARDHADRLAALVARADGRLAVMAGGKVRGDHVRHLVAFTGVGEVHARAQGIPGIARALGGA